MRRHAWTFVFFLLPDFGCFGEVDFIRGKIKGFIHFYAIITSPRRLLIAVPLLIGMVFAF